MLSLQIYSGKKENLYFSSWIQKGYSLECEKGAGGKRGKTPSQDCFLIIIFKHFEYCI